MLTPVPGRAMLVAVVALAGLTAACTAAPAPAAPTLAQRVTSISIGLLAPTTGGAAERGRQAQQGAELAVEVINNDHPDLSLPLAAGAGLAGGVKAELRVGDTAGDADAAVAQVTRLVRDERVAGLVVADATAVVAAAGRQAEQLAVPLLDACSSADSLSDADLDWYYRIGPTDRRLAETAFALLRQQQGQGAQVRKLTLLESPTGQGGGVGGMVRELVDRAGYEIAGELAVTAKLAPAELADRVEQSRPDAVLAVVSTDREVEIVNDAARRLRSVPVLIVGGGLVGIAGADGATGAPGVLRTVGWSADFASRSPAARAVVELYRQRFGAPMGAVAAHAFTATLALAAAVDSAASTDAARVRGALRQLSVPATKMIMPWNGIRFDDSGRNPLASGVVEQRGQVGFQVVYPRELAATALTWRR